MDDVGADGDAATFTTGDAAMALVADDQKREKLGREREKICVNNFILS